MKTKQTDDLKVMLGPEGGIEKPYNSGDSDVAIVAGGLGLAVLCCYQRSVEERRKYGALFAAAPELLEALEDCVDELWQLHEQIHPKCIADRPKRCPSRAAIEKARTAIANATEKQEKG